MSDLPGTPPLIAVAAGGPRAARIASELGDGLFATEPRPDLTAAYRDAGGTGPRYAEVPLAWAPDEDAAAKSAHELFCFGPTGWKVQAELPNPVDVEAATAFVRTDDIKEALGPDPARHLDVALQFVDAGFDRLVLIDAGPDADGVLDFFASGLNGPVRASTPSS